jgi:NADH-quinone oxidoreductase subunit L
MDPSIVLIQQLLFYVIALPLAGAIINGLVGHRLPRTLVGLVACTAPLAAFVCSVRIFWALRTLGENASTAFVGGAPAINATAFQWLSCGPLHIEARLCADPLSAIMMLVITGVGSLIHIYSLGYMSHEPAFSRYFAYLNLFVAAMLVLVLGDSLPVMFVGWEGVGLVSYLLIGFWFLDADKAAAGKKAFIVNRIGDAGFVCAMLVLFRFAHDLTFSGLARAAASQSMTTNVATAACLLLVLGATGKSAQIPLYVWLPDAMAGPTPVSALIHAATMVTAGVYLVARVHFLFALAPVAMLTLAVLGALSALIAASIAVVQNDIKKVLAYSTVSQLGFMMMAAGVGAYHAAMFHVVTHAFFKACLFLGAGSVIHALAGEQDMRQMGGLRGKMPVTSLTMLLSTLAITGAPGFSGFVSKDAILASVLASGSGAHAEVFGAVSSVLWAMGIAAAALTSFYMWRLMFLTFWSGAPRAAAAGTHVHESPPTMRWPLIVLALLATFSGGLGWPALLGGHDWFGSWLGLQSHVHEASAASEWLSMGVATGVFALGFLLAWALYARRVHPVTHRLASGGLWRGVYTGALNKWYVDALYDALIVRPWVWVSRVVLFEGVDRRIIGGAVGGVAWGVRSVGFLGQLFHSGNIQRYLAIFVVGLSVMLYGWLSPGVHIAHAPHFGVVEGQKGTEGLVPGPKGP